MATYKVKAGDTLSKIAKQFNTSVTAIATTNHITNVNLIKVGQVLTIPEESNDVKWKTFKQCVKAIESLPEFKVLEKLM